jgi:hypothetical protein
LALRWPVVSGEHDGPSFQFLQRGDRDRPPVERDDDDGLPLVGECGGLLGKPIERDALALEQPAVVECEPPSYHQ